MREYEALVFMNKYIRDNGYSPTVREISDAVGLKSSSGGFEIVHSLAEKGLVEYNPKHPRSISLTEKAKTLFNEEQNIVLQQSIEELRKAAESNEEIRNSLSVAIKSMEYIIRKGISVDFSED